MSLPDDNRNDAIYYTILALRVRAKRAWEKIPTDPRQSIERLLRKALSSYLKIPQWVRTLFWAIAPAFASYYLVTTLLGKK